MLKRGVPTLLYFKGNFSGVWSAVPQPAWMYSSFLKIIQEFRMPQKHCEVVWPASILSYAVAVAEEARFGFSCRTNMALNYNFSSFYCSHCAIYQI